MKIYLCFCNEEISSAALLCTFQKFRILLFIIGKNFFFLSLILCCIMACELDDIKLYFHFFLIVNNFILCWFCYEKVSLQMHKRNIIDGDVDIKKSKKSGKRKSRRWQIDYSNFSFHYISRKYFSGYHTSISKIEVRSIMLANFQYFLIPQNIHCYIHIYVYIYRNNMSVDTNTE